MDVSRRKPGLVAAWVAAGSGRVKYPPKKEWAKDGAENWSFVGQGRRPSWRNIPKTPRAPDIVSVVYFVEIGEHIKIGVTTRLESRLQACRNASPDVQLLLTVPGNRTLERQLHDLFGEYKVAREIFRPDRRILSFIEHVEYGGLDRGLRYLEETTLAARTQANTTRRIERTRVARLDRAAASAHYASLVAERKRQVGW
jgi:hypothetical protein